LAKSWSVKNVGKNFGVKIVWYAAPQAQVVRVRAVGKKTSLDCKRIIAIVDLGRKTIMVFF